MAIRWLLVPERSTKIPITVAAVAARASPGREGRHVLTNVFKYASIRAPSPFFFNIIIIIIIIIILLCILLIDRIK